MQNFLSIPRQWKARIEAASEWQTNTLKVMTVLPGAHQYAEVERAIRVSGVHPSDLYACLASGSTSFIVLRFYQALLIK